MSQETSLHTTHGSVFVFTFSTNGVYNKQIVGNDPESLCRACWHGRFSGLGVFTNLPFTILASTCGRSREPRLWQTIGSDAVGILQREWMIDGPKPLVATWWRTGRALWRRSVLAFSREMLVEIDGFCG
jgi:hypothetical protein